MFPKYLTPEKNIYIENKLVLTDIKEFQIEDVQHETFTPVPRHCTFPRGSGTYLKWAPGGPPSVYRSCGPFLWKIPEGHCPPESRVCSPGPVEVFIEVKVCGKNHVSNSLLVFGLPCSVMLSCDNEPGVTRRAGHPC